MGLALSTNERPLISLLWELHGQAPCGLKCLSLLGQAEPWQSSVHGRSEIAAIEPRRQTVLGAHRGIPKVHARCVRPYHRTLGLLTALRMVWLQRVRRTAITLSPAAARSADRRGVELIGYAVEQGRKSPAERGGCADDGDSDQCGDQAILNCGGAGLVGCKLADFGRFLPSSRLAMAITRQPNAFCRRVSTPRDRAPHLGHRA